LVKEGEEFIRMPFEGGGNGMNGHFCYTKLEERLKAIRTAIDEETQMWIDSGRKAHENSERVASNLKHQFEQCKQHFERNPGGVTLALDMERDNPFVWTMVHPKPRPPRPLPSSVGAGFVV
jgi:ubiquitin-conjugating enzyme E2 Z